MEIDVVRYLNSVGKRVFINCYELFQDTSKSEEELANLIPTFDAEAANATKEGLEMKASFAKGIFKAGLQKEALRLCLNADRLPEEIKAKAQKIYDTDYGTDTHISLNDLRSKLIEFGQIKGADVIETNEYTAFKTKRNIAEIHKINSEKSKRFLIVVSFKALPEDLQKLVERVPSSYKWTNLDAKFYINSQDTLEQAKKLIEAGIKYTNSSNQPIIELIKKYENFKTSKKYDEQYKWTHAIKNQSVFDNLDNLAEKLPAMWSVNFQTYFMRNSGIKWMLDKHPEELRNSLQCLFDSEKNLKDCIQAFRNIIKDTLNNDEDWKNKNLADPGVDTASFFLFSNDFKNHMLFTKMSPFNEYAKKLGLSHLLKYETPEDRYLNWQNYCQGELISLMNETLQKENDLLDAQDFIWVVGNGLLDNNIKSYYWLNLTPQDVSNLTINDTFEYSTLIETGTERPNFKALKAEDKVLGYVCFPEKRVKFILEYQRQKEENAIFRIKEVLEKPVTFDSLQNVEALKDSDVIKKQNMGKCLFSLTPEEFQAIIEISLKSLNSEGIKVLEHIPFNQILYGPPGTGKTYTTRNLLNEILKEQVEKLNTKNISNEDQKLKETIEKLTWFEVLAIALYRNGKTTYRVNEIKSLPEIKEYFKIKNCQSINPAIWAQLQIHTGLDSTTVNYKTRQQPFIFDKRENSEWFLTETGKKYVEEELNDILKRLQAPQQYKIEDFYKFITFHQSYSYEEFVEGIKPEVDDESNVTYRVTDGIFKKICAEARENMDKAYVLVIDEINRGNISKIFGELITLIEDNKRIGNKEALEVSLPYSQEKFGAPANLFIIGTMNTSDRSIASIDIALRRRFKFKEVMPDPTLVPVEVEGIQLRTLFESLNKKISILLDRDHQIGHSYFIGITTIEQLKTAWFDCVIPLLNEYFYGEWDKLQALLRDFIEVKDIPAYLKSLYDEDKYFDFKKPDQVNFFAAMKKLEDDEQSKAYEYEGETSAV